MKYSIHEYTLWTALNVGAWTGSVEIASLLLDAAAEINMPLPRLRSLTTLQSAIFGHYVTTVQFMLDRGATFHACGNRYPRTVHDVLQGSIGMGILNALAVAGEHFDRIFDLYHVISSREAVQTSLDSGALMHWTGNQKGHLLQDVIKRGYTDLIQGMLDAGADVNTPAAENFGRTALQGAAEKGYTDTVTLLLSYGADVNAQSWTSWGCHGVASSSTQW